MHTNSGEYYNWEKKLKPERPYFHKYHQSLVLKMFLSIPDNKGGSIVGCSFQQALNRIKKLNEITLKVPKIIYLVGWQYNGHDDCYPAWHQVNPRLKRVEDADGETSLNWLMSEARKYNTTVSLHINMTDAYRCSPLWHEYLAEDLIAKNIFNRPLKIGKWNNRVAYQINYSNEFASGYAQRRIDWLIEKFNLQNINTIHIDAFFCRGSIKSKVSVKDEKVARRKIIRYWRDQNIDVTSEFIYKEGREEDLIGLVPMVWWLNQSVDDYMQRPPSLICGGRPNKNYKGYKRNIDKLFGKSIHGEDLWLQAKGYTENPNWERDFTERFCLDTLVFIFLNSLNRIEIKELGKEQVICYSDDISAFRSKHLITDGTYILKDGTNVLVPSIYDNSLICYSKIGYLNKMIMLPKTWHKFQRVLLVSGEIKEVITVTNGQINLTLKPETMYTIYQI